jgi:tetratricopeptide (TPR) repeat protein
MKLITLDRALDNIKMTVDRAKHNGNPSPYFFIVGAGVSFPPVKLAGQIIEDCKTEAKKFGWSDEVSFPSKMKEYSIWFERAYSNPDDRRNYISDLIKDTKISDANLWLAHILSRGKISDLVVTPNFDDHLERALSLFGEQPIVCDHAGTVKRIETDRRGLKIVHVHSSYRFYDACNLTSEIRAKAREKSIYGFLTDILGSKVPLIVGYSGWDGDVIMTVLKSELKERLRHNLYWFCYNEADIDNLPDWLKNTDNVHLVAATEIVRKKCGEMTTEELKRIGFREGTDKIRVEIPGMYVGADTSLHASDVFLKLIEKFAENYQDRVPEIFREPLEHFAKTLENSLPPIDEKESNGIRLRLKDSIERVRKAAEWEKLEFEERRRQSERAQENNVHQSTALCLDQIKAAFTSSKFSDVIDLVKKLNLPELNAEQLNDLFERIEYSSKQLSISNNYEYELDGYNLLIRIYDLQKSYSSENTELIRNAASKALVNKGFILDQLTRFEEAIQTYEEVERRFSDVTNSELLLSVANALVNKGYTLIQLKRFEESIAVCEEVEQRFGTIDEAAFKEVVALSLVNKSLAIIQLKRFEESIAVCEEVEQRFAGMEETWAKEALAIAFCNKGFSMLCIAKKVWSEGKEELAIAKLSKAQEATLSSLKYMPEYAINIGNQGYIFFLLGKEAEARKTLTRAIQIGGEQIRQTELADSEIYPLPLDEEFRKLINSIPYSKP